MEAAAEEGPPGFRCPEDFVGRRFAPGPPFSPQALQGAAKRRLLLIRAPADFPPESLDGHAVPLTGSHTVKTSQPDGREKAYKIQRGRLEDLGSCTRLLLPSGHREGLTCAPLFSGSLSIHEKYGGVGAPQALLPLTPGLAPHIPGGLRQRFLPFGCQPRTSPPPWNSAEKAPRRKKKKLQRLGGKGDSEQPLPWEGSPGEQARARHHPHPLKGAGKAEAAAGLPGQDPQAGSSAGDLASGETEGPGRRNSKKKKKSASSVGTDKGQDIHSTAQQAECDLWDELEPGAGLLGPDKCREEKLQPGTAAGETVRGPQELSSLGSFSEGNVASTKEDPGGQFPTKRKKRKKREEEAAGEDVQSTFLEPSPITLDLREGGVQETVWGQEESAEPSMEAPNQKHKRKRRKQQKGGLD